MAPDGAYLVSSTDESTLPAGLELRGDGHDRSVIRRSYKRAGPFILHCDSRSSDPAANIERLSFTDLAFEDEVVERGFSEYDYLVMLNGVSDVLFDRVRFTGFRGDGLHLGSSTRSKVERHNQNVTVRDCVFDGVNANNRNAISVIDCAGLVIEKSRFLNCSREGDGGRSEPDPMNPRTGIPMPGPIDLEPNQDSFAIIRDISIRDNVFSGGGGQAVCLNLLPDAFVDSAQTEIVIHDNVMRDRWGAFGVQGGTPAAAANTRSQAIRFIRNDVRHCTKAFIVDGVRGVSIEDNVFADCGTMAELGYVHGNRDVSLVANRFDRLGREESGYGLWVRAVDGLTISENIFSDIGFADGKFGIAIAFVEGVMRDVSIQDNEFVSPEGRTTEAITVFQKGAPVRETFSIGGNRLRFEAPGLAGALGI